MIDEAQEANGWRDTPEDEQLRNAMSAVDFATYLAARVGYLMLVTDLRMNTSLSSPETQEIMTDAGEAERSCRETELLLGKVIKFYSEERQKRAKLRSEAHGSEHWKKPSKSWGFTWLGSRSNDGPEAHLGSSPLDETNSDHILEAMMQQVLTAKTVLSNLRR